MFRRTLAFRLTTHLTAASALILTMGAPVHAVPIMINNGFAPPNAENVIDAADNYSGDDVYVRNVGCPPGWPAVSPNDPCSSPGAATEVEVVSGGTAGDFLRVYDSSTVTMSDGATGPQIYSYNSSTIAMTDGATGGQLRAYDTSTITMSGGMVGGSVNAYDSSIVTMTGGTVAAALWSHDTSAITMSDGSVGNYLRTQGSSSVTISGGSVGTVQAWGSSTITMSGGTVGGDLEVEDSSIITFIGSDFMVNGELVPYGDLSALTGTLTGTLALGGSLDNTFYQGGYAGSYTGTITLVPEPSTALLLAFGLVGIAAKQRRSAARFH